MSIRLDVCPEYERNMSSQEKKYVLWPFQGMTWSSVSKQVVLQPKKHCKHLVKLK